MTVLKFLGASALALVATAVEAKSVSGSFDGLNWTAASTIIGRNSTATVAGGGDPRYLARNAGGYSGVVGILTTYSNGDQFVCSGSLIGDRSVLTAGHCVSSGGGVQDPSLVNIQVIFQNNASSNADAYIYNLPTGTTAIRAGSAIVNPLYTGEVIDQNDIAVVRLSEIAPAYAERYGIYSTTDLTGDRFNVSGYGIRSDTGGSVGSNLSTGRRREGNNRYDYALGDSVFDGFFTDHDANGNTFFGTADVEYSYLSDFDSGVAANDASCLLAMDFGANARPRYCNLGGDKEVTIGGGDSGGPAFIDGRVASVNSYGLSFGTFYGDIDDELNDTYGEFAGYVPTFIHQDFIAGALAVPEPSQWAMMFVGFGVLGGAMRRRQTKVSVTFA